MSYIRPQDQIQDGVVNRSPTENAVYDALALKAATNLQNLSLSGSNGQVLTLVSGVPAWAALPASGVTSVTASAPLASSGGTTPNLSISQASALTDGYLSSTDWSTFNGKQNALTIGNLTELTSSVLTITGGTGAVIGSGTTIQVTQSGVATNGYLSSTDWNTFNNKAVYPSQTGNVDKVLATDGTNTSWQYAGLGAGALGTDNVVLGRAKPATLTGTANFIAGATAAASISTGTNNVAIGNGSGGVNLTTGSNGVAVGVGAVVTSSNATAIGANASATGDASFGGVAIGHNSTSSNQNVAVGKGCTAGNARNVSIGLNANTGTNADSIAIGANARTDGTNSITIGSSSVAYNTSVQNSIGLNGSCTVVSSTLLGRTLNLYFNNHGVTRASVAALSENQIFANSYSTGGATNNGDASGGILTLNGAQGTGTGIGGDIRFRTAPAGAVSNNVQNALVEMVRIKQDGKVGIGTSAPATLLHAQQTSAATNTVTDVLRVDSQSSGTPAAGIGVGIEMAAETAAGNTEIGVVLEAVTTDVTSTSEDFDFVVKNMAAGAAATETLRVTSTGNTKVTGGDLSVETVGKGLKIKEGTNAKMGITGAFPTGSPNTVTVSTTAVTASSRIFLTAQSDPAGVNAALTISSVTAGTSFDIRASNTNFNGTVAWMIVEPA
jgi:trimeric autotransporter adhesin